MIWVAITATMLAVAEQTGFWDTSTGRQVADVVRALVGIGVIAAAWKGVRYMSSEVLGLHKWGLSRYHERKRRDVLLDEMLAPDGWPAMKEQMSEMVLRMTELQTAVEHVLTTDTEE